MLSEDIQEKVVKLAESITQEASRFIQTFLMYNINRGTPKENILSVTQYDGMVGSYKGKDYCVDFTKMSQQGREQFAAAVTAVEKGLEIDLRDKNSPGVRVPMDVVEHMYKVLPAKISRDLSPEIKIENGGLAL